MTLVTRTVTLPGGLQATLVHQPHADRAAALARVAATTNHRAFPVWRTCWSICCFTAVSATGMMTG